MTTQQMFKQTEEEEQAIRAQRAFRLLFVLGGIVFLAALTIFLRIWSNNNFVYFEEMIEPGSGIIAGAIILLGAFLARRGHVTLAILLASIAFFGVNFYLVSRLEQIGLPLTITVTVSLILIASQTLPRRYVPVGIITIFAGGSLILLTDLFWVADRNGIATTDLRIVYAASILIVFVATIVAMRQFPTFSLSTKLITVAIGLVVITVFFTTILVNSITRESLTEQLNEKFQLIGRSSALAVVELLEQQLEIVQTLSLDSGLRALVNVQNSQYSDDEEDTLNRILERDDEWVNDESGGLQNFITNNTTALTLRKFQNIFPGHVEMFLTDQYGGLVGATNVTSDYYQADEEWWQRAYNDGEGDTYIGEPEYDESSGVIAVNIAVPMYDAEGEQILGIMRSTFDVSELTELLTGAGGIGQTGHVDILFKENQLHVEDERAGLAPIDLEPELLERLKNTTENIIAEDNGYPSLINLIPLDTDGDNAFVDDLEWYLIISQAEQEAFVAVRQQQQVTIILALVAIFIGALLASYFSRLIANPINRLTETAVVIAEGNLNRRASVETQDEIGTLAVAFKPHDWSA